jgi:hypothetical protein
MTMVRVAIGVIWVVSFGAGRHMWHSPVPSPIAATSAEITAPSVAGAVTGEPVVEPGDSDDDGPDQRFDLFGNEIEEAVEDYRLDLRGGLYERHSPETAVAKLGSPST